MDAEEDSYLGVSELPDSDKDVENVHPDILQIKGSPMGIFWWIK